MLKKSKFFLFTLYLALGLIGAVMPSCRSTETVSLPYKVERNSYYQDLILDISRKGKIDIAHTEDYLDRENNREKKHVLFSQDIRPVDMNGAKKFISKNFDLLMQTPGEISQELYFPGGNNRILVHARGTNFEGEAAQMRVGVDDSELGVVDVLPELDSYAFPMQLDEGHHRIRISFLNGEQQRKLVITNVKVDRVVIDYPTFIHTYMAMRLQDDTLNGFEETTFVIMGKINSVSRRSLFMPSPSRVEVMLNILENTTLQFAAGIDEYVWSAESSGCEFQVIFEENNKEHILYNEKFQPYENESHRKWYEVSIDLSEFQSIKGILRFETRPLSSQNAENTTNLGYVLLANPRIISPRTVTEPNIVLISIDTLRRDHLSTYGYTKKTSPFLDSLAAESAVFENAIAQAPYTVTSHITMMTSLWPSVHQILTHDYQDRLSPKWLTLPQILKASGYLTGGFTGGGQVSAVYGFDRGMDVYDCEGGRSEKIFPKAIEWIAKAQGNPFFLFLHTYDVHMPYEPPPPYDSLFDPEYNGTVWRWTEECVKIIDPKLFNRILDLYDGEICYVDAQIQRVVQFLREQGLFENTMLIITSDHGEEFMEHGTMACHAHTLYNELLFIPLIIKFPDGQWAGRTIPNQVALNDLMPTVLDYLDIPFPPHSQGQSLLDLFLEKAGSDVQRPIFSEQIVLKDDPRVEVSVQTLSEKYYQRLGLPAEYFDLKNDPGERHDLLESQKKKASVFRQYIREYVTSNRKLAKLGLETNGSRSQKMDKATLDRLKALGYIK